MLLAAVAALTPLFVFEDLGGGLPFFTIDTAHVPLVWAAAVLGLVVALLLVVARPRRYMDAGLTLVATAGLVAFVHYTGRPAILTKSLPIQPFGILVAAGVLVGAEVMRRYMLRFGVDEDDIRGLTLWLIVSGFLGAHLFDAIVYEHERLSADPILILKVWDGISSWGGFLGGALGYVTFVWWKRLSPGLMADSSIVGLLVAFTIGRMGCTIVHDHIGRATTSGFGIDYPREEIRARHLLDEFPGAGAVIRAHNVALYELTYLLLVCALVLPLALGKRRLPAGLLAVVVGMLYAPVRFFLEYWRLATPDPRYGGLTFAQWCSALAFLVAGYVAVRLWKTGTPAPLADELGGRPGGRLATMQQLVRAKAKGEALPEIETGKGKDDSKGKDDGKGKGDGKARRAD